MAIATRTPLPRHCSRKVTSTLSSCAAPRDTFAPRQRNGNSRQRETWKRRPCLSVHYMHAYIYILTYTRMFDSFMNLIATGRDLVGDIAVTVASLPLPVTFATCTRSYGSLEVHTNDAAESSTPSTWHALVPGDVLVAVEGDSDSATWTLDELTSHLQVATLPLTLTFRTPALYLRYLRQHPATSATAAAATTSSTSMSRAMFPPSKEYKAKHKVIGSPLAANDKGEWHTAHAKLKQNKWLAYFEASVVLKRNHVRILTAALPPHLQCHHWKLLFTTQEHGFNSSVLYHRVHDRGPTVVAIKDSTDQVFGAFTPSSLKHSKKVYGNGRAFVFQHKSVYGWSGLDSNFVYGGPSGSIIWGGGPTGLALCLQLDEARGFTQPCDTFDSPALTHPHQFHCWAVEVWGFEGVKL
ncbi:hypothetical protein, variant 1 [Aphanomyces astaci]|uniref:TLDc domain-containing protein n=1 Tax=Aphanomyces astaci TaxID=112090 RepID=W4FEW2_APHAT|nr:hypothetical protein, variant 1 [Aphanomyces astaci]ETV66005.1 hypothetical protein, variant 1 [Aphanomyces astaci]|eukprot:XP_009844525.1 hypothetical protein, variant 1 [Aphanomyces astaci]